MKQLISALFLITASAVGSVALSTSASWANDTDATRSSKEIDQLVQDYRAHDKRCHGVTSKQATNFKRCTNEQAALLQRQKEHGVSDDQLKRWIYP